MARPSLSLRIIPRFPAKVLPGDGIAIIRTGGSITIDMDWSNIAQASFPVDPSGLEFTLRQADGSFVRVPVEEIVLPQVTWDTLSGKPSEFPPSAHTHTIPNIVGLQSALDSKVDDTDVIDVAHGGSGRASATAYAVLCGGSTGTGAHQSVAGLGSSGDILTSNGAGALPTFQTPAGLTGAVRYDTSQSLSSGEQTQARTNINAQPQPTASAGVGQKTQISAASGSALVLPAGGTWEWEAFGYASAGTNIAAGVEAGVAAGGATVRAGSAGVVWTGSALRIA